MKRNGKPSRYTSEKFELAGVTVYDSKSKIRTDIIKPWLKNSIDVVRFYHAMGKYSLIICAIYLRGFITARHAMLQSLQAS